MCSGDGGDGSGAGGAGVAGGAGESFCSSGDCGFCDDSPVADDFGTDNSICGQLFENGLCLPSHPGLSEADLQRIVAVFKNCAAARNPSLG